MATLHRERVEHALNELLVRIVPEDPNENEDEANQRFEDAYEFALDELTTAGDASLVPDVQHIASLIDRKVSGPNNDQRKSARLHNLLSRLETQSVLDQKWRMLYFLYNLSDNAEAPHEPPPAQDTRSFSREPTTPSKRQSVAASSHAIQDAFAKPGLAQLPANAGSPKAPPSTRPASIAEKPEKRRRPDTAKEQQQANGGHVEKAETGPSEPILLRELPFTLQGYSSTNLAFPSSTALKLPTTLPVPIVSLLHTLAEPAILYKGLAEFVEASDGGLIEQSFRAALAKELRAYLGLVATLEGQIKRALAQLNEASTPQGVSKAGVTLKRCVI